MNRTSTVFYLAMITSISGFAYWQYTRNSQPETIKTTLSVSNQEQKAFTRANTLSGSYLAGRFAQRHYDWKAASGFIGQILAQHPNDPSLLKREMVLAMGSGDPDQAITLARRVDMVDPNKGALPELFLALADFKTKNYIGAHKHIMTMTNGGLSDFILPLLKSWADASIGINNTKDLTTNTIHIYHAILINDFLKKPENIEVMLNTALNTPDLSSEDIERIADLYAYINKNDKARTLYKQALNLAPENTELSDKLSQIDKNEKPQIFSKITTAEHGIAEALFDMARLLAQEYNDESALVFAQMAAYLNPEMTKSKFLLAALAARNNHFNEAIEAYHSISPNDKNYLDARRTAADLMEQEGQTDNALKELDQLADQYNDIQAIIQIGDLHRENENFAQAIKAYNRAEQALGGHIPADYWHLLYVRGMAYEQTGDWARAEEDLKAALKYQPSHPYILNYLGYAWADQGIHLDQALGMIEKAVSVRPDDGYITDSLGWVLYRMNKFKEAVPYLEQAVALMPYDITVNEHLGDVYWQVGRRLEARFQWERAKNHAKDENQIKTLEAKIADGLPEVGINPEKQNSFALDKREKNQKESQKSD